MKRRILLLAGVVLVAAFAWTTASMWSPWYGWVGRLGDRANIAKMRSKVIPPCESRGWVSVVLSDRTVVELPDCYEHVTQGDILIGFDLSSTLPIMVSTFHGDTSGLTVAGEPTSGWDACASDDRPKVFCQDQRGGAGGREVFFRRRLIVTPDTAVLIQGGVPGYLENTEVERSVTETLDGMIERVVLMEQESSSDDERDAPTLDGWAGQQVIQYVIVSMSLWDAKERLRALRAARRASSNRIRSER